MPKYSIHTVTGRIITTVMLIALTSCVKDKIYNTSHPEEGELSLTIDWSARGEGITAPGEQMVKTGDYQGQLLKGVKCVFPYLLKPGVYKVYTWNPTQEIGVEGTTATLKSTAPGHVDTQPEWWFSAKTEAGIEKDTENHLVLSMKQQVRQLNLILKPQGETAGKIVSIHATLTGIAGAWDLENDTPTGNPASGWIDFTRITEGENVGSWLATVRLLGTNGAQKLTGTVRFEGNNPSEMPLESDLSEKLQGFNQDKRTPLSLEAAIVPTPTTAGFTAIITPWKKVVNQGVAE